MYEEILWEDRTHLSDSTDSRDRSSHDQPMSPREEVPTPSEGWTSSTATAGGHESEASSSSASNYQCPAHFYDRDAVYEESPRAIRMPCVSGSWADHGRENNRKFREQAAEGSTDETADDFSRRKALPKVWAVIVLGFLQFSWAAEDLDLWSTATWQRVPFGLNQGPGRWQELINKAKYHQVRLTPAMARLLHCSERCEEDCLGKSEGCTSVRCCEQKQFPFRSRCQVLMGAAYSLVWSGLLPFGGVVCNWGDYGVSWVYVLEDWFAETCSAEASGLYYACAVLLGWLNMIRDSVVIWFCDVPMLCISEVRFRLPWVAAVAGVTIAYFWGQYHHLAHLRRAGDQTSKMLPATATAVSGMGPKRAARRPTAPRPAEYPPRRASRAAVGSTIQWPADAATAATSRPHLLSSLFPFGVILIITRNDVRRWSR